VASAAALLAAVLAVTRPLAPQEPVQGANVCYLGLVVAQNQELGLLVLGMGKALAPTVRLGRPIEPFWPSVMVCMRQATAEEQALLEAAEADSVP